MESKFSFLKEKYKPLYDAATIAEKIFHIDASASIAKSRLFAELLIRLIATLEKIDITGLNPIDIINKLNDEYAIPSTVKELLHTIRKSGNNASHKGESSKAEGIFTLKKMYALARWFYETYEFKTLEKEEYDVPASQSESLEALNQKIEALQIRNADYAAQIEDLNKDKITIEARRVQAQEAVNRLEWSEEETRINLIDDQLRIAGWECDTTNLNFWKHKTVPQKGRNMAIAEWPCGGKRADYALFIGTQLFGLVEAKKFGKDISTDLRQSKEYAEKIVTSESFQFIGKWNKYHVPFLFSTNGRKYFEQLKIKSGIWILDVRNSNNTSYPLNGWMSPDGLQAIFQRDIEAENEKLKSQSTDYLTEASGLALRDYQVEAIHAVEKHLIESKDSKSALLVMATGTGKTRTINGLIYRLIKANRFKRILFLTDRRLLATQARDSIIENKVESLQSFSGIYKFDDLKTAIPDVESRLTFATVQSMVKRLFFSENPLTVDTFDCIIVDEAHRGYQLDREMDEDDFEIRNEEDYVAQYRKVLDYFDAYRIGMTATPALHTARIFGSAVYSYSYRQAVIDGNLVDHEPPYNIKTQLNSEGIHWASGDKPKTYDVEKGEIIELEALEDNLDFDVEDFNKQVLNDNFNRVVLRELVQHIDPNGPEKSLIFAARDSHADTIVQILKEEFKNADIEINDNAIQKITGSIYDEEQLTKNFKNEKFPTVAVTVDLLTTGIDVPTICNLVFMRRVKSRILYEQMIGRATRLCPEIGKEAFKIFDAVRLYEAMDGFTQMQAVTNPSYSFQQLVAEEAKIVDALRLQKLKEQLIAKLNRKLPKMSEAQNEQFTFQSDGISPENFKTQLKELEGDVLRQFIQSSDKIWAYLDKKVYNNNPIFISEHADEVQEVSQGYSNGSKKPEDYIEAFQKYITQNKNKIAALELICTKPESLTRKDLKSLKLELDALGFNEVQLNKAWKNAKNVDIAADIIGYIRSLALGNTLETPETRVQRAISKIKGLKAWNVQQKKWIDRFEKQLLSEKVLQKSDLDLQPFISDGGYKRLDKIFNNELDSLIQQMNHFMYESA